jgi:hypothetical protein
MRASARRCRFEPRASARTARRQTVAADEPRSSPRPRGRLPLRPGESRRVEHSRAGCSWSSDARAHADCNSRLIRSASGFRTQRPRTCREYRFRATAGAASASVTVALMRSRTRPLTTLATGACRRTARERSDRERPVGAAGPGRATRSRSRQAHRPNRLRSPRSVAGPRESLATRAQ